MSLSKTIAINTLAQVFGKFGVLIFGIITTIFLRRFLGRSGYGDYVFITSFTLMLVSLADFGTHLIGVKEASQQSQKQIKIISSVFLLRLLLTSLTVIIGLFIIKVFFPHQPLTNLLFLSLLLMVAIMLKNSLTIIFHTKLKLTYAGLMDGLTAGLILLITIILLYLKQNLYWLISGLALVYGLIFLLFLPLSQRLIPFSFTLDKKLIKKIIKEILPMGGILFLYTCYSKFDTLALKIFWGSEVVGVYGLAYKIHENLIVLAAFLMNSLLPILSQTIADKKKFSFLLQKTFDVLLLSGLGILLIIFIAAPLIIKIIIGKMAVNEIIALRVLVFATFVSFLNHLTGYTIISLGEQKKSFLISVLALVFNVVSNLIFIPLFSFKAAAVNTFLTEGLVLVFSSLVIYKKLHWFPHLFSFPKTALAIIRTKGKIYDGE